jgi:hypothetical protein
MVRLPLGFWSSIWRRILLFCGPYPSPQNNATAIADIQQFMSLVVAQGDAGILSTDQVAELLATAQAIIAEIPAA